jgi:hypothetical protein
VDGDSSVATNTHVSQLYLAPCTAPCFQLCLQRIVGVHTTTSSYTICKRFLVLQSPNQGNYLSVNDQTRPTHTVSGRSVLHNITRAQVRGRHFSYHHAKAPSSPQNTPCLVKVHTRPCSTSVFASIIDLPIRFDVPNTCHLPLNIHLLLHHERRDQMFGGT